MNHLRKIRNAIMWIAAYEVWRLNAKATYKAIRLIRDHKDDEGTWGEAIYQAREHVRAEAHGDL